MSREVKLSRVRTVLDDLSYPVGRDEAIDALEDVTLLYADGTEPLADVLARSGEDTFESVDDLHSEVLANVPQEAVGEPGQSEGEG